MINDQIYFMYLLILSAINFLFISLILFFILRKKSIKKNSINRMTLKNSRSWINDLIKIHIHAIQLEINLTTIIFTKEININIKEYFLINFIIDYNFLKIIINGLSRDSSNKFFYLFINNFGEIKAISIPKENINIVNDNSCIYLNYLEKNKSFSILLNQINNQNELSFLSPGQSILLIENILQSSINQ